MICASAVTGPEEPATGSKKYFKRRYQRPPAGSGVCIVKELAVGNSYAISGASPSRTSTATGEARHICSFNAQPKAPAVVGGWTHDSRRLRLGVKRVTFDRDRYRNGRTKKCPTAPCVHMTPLNMVIPGHSHAGIGHDKPPAGGQSVKSRSLVNKRADCQPYLRLARSFSC